MSEKHENIEDFVRKVVDQSESQILFNESHWNQMEAMLDAELPVATDPGMGYYYFSNVISLLVGVVFLWIWIVGGLPSENLTIADQGVEVAETIIPAEDSGNEVEVSEEIKQEEVKAGLRSNEEPGVANTQVGEQPIDEKSTVQSTLSPDESASTDVLETSNSEVQENETIASAEASSGVITSEESSSEDSTQSNNEAIDERKIGPRNSKVADTSLSSGIEEDNVIEESNEGTITLVDNDDEITSIQYLPPTGKGIDFNSGAPNFPDQLATVDIYDPDGGSNADEKNPIVNRRSVRSSYDRFSVGISLSPDLSSNEVFRYNRLGRDLGITIDYWVAPRWSVSVGVFNTAKRYLVGGEEYSPPPGFWGNVTNGERPAMIDADCQVLDIPINLKYKLVSRPKLNIYASAGVSSYIMLRENYKYELANGWKSEWGVSNANQHFFGVGNLQIHFERRFGKHFAVEAAPFFKVPLTSYGHGNIRFHSMGSFFTLRKYFLNR